MVQLLFFEVFYKKGKKKKGKGGGEREKKKSRPESFCLSLLKEAYKQ